MTSTLYAVDFQARELQSKTEIVFPSEWNPNHPSLWEPEPENAA